MAAPEPRNRIERAGSCPLPGNKEIKKRRCLCEYFMRTAPLLCEPAAGFKSSRLSLIQFRILSVVQHDLCQIQHAAKTLYILIREIRQPVKDRRQVRTLLRLKQQGIDGDIQRITQVDQCCDGGSYHAAFKIRDILEGYADGLCQPFLGMACGKTRPADALSDRDIQGLLRFCFWCIFQKRKR